MLEMSMGWSMLANYNYSWKQIGVIYLCVLINLISIAFISIIFDKPVALLTRDPTEILDVSPFYGALSKVGIIIWSVSGTICIFSSFLVIDTIYKQFLFVAGSITYILMFDDLFVAHEYLFSRYLNISEETVYILYFGMITIFLIWFRNFILQTQYLYLLAALVFFGLSIILDMIPSDRLIMHHLFEDGFKIFGIVSWGYYLVAISYQELKQTVKITESAPEKSIS